MRRPRVATRILRWGLTLATVILGTACGLSFFYSYGVIKTVPYPGYAPKWADYCMMQGGFFYFAGQGGTDTGSDSPLDVIGTHWQWTRNHANMAQLWSWPRLHGSTGHVWIPAWLIVGPPLAASLALWMPVIFARRRRRPGECECGYDLSGAPSATCPECGRGGDGSNAAAT